MLVRMSVHVFTMEKSKEEKLNAAIKDQAPKDKMECHIFVI